MLMVTPLYLQGFLLELHPLDHSHQPIADLIVQLSVLLGLSLLGCSLDLVCRKMCCVDIWMFVLALQILWLVFTVVGPSIGRDVHAESKVESEEKLVRVRTFERILQNNAEKALAIFATLPSLALAQTVATTLTIPPMLSPNSSSAGVGRFSVVLACAQEGEFMVKTVRSFCDRTPSDILEEVIVVDDGSMPPLEHLLIDIEFRCRVRVLRHSKTLGLMVAKQTGGDAAIGEFIGFFDCHVAPNVGWHRELMSILQLKPRRLAVPLITDLNIDTWDEKVASSEYSKCYVDFEAQFMWFNDDSDYIPIISGGLVAITQSWWHLSGGFDSMMRGWGGENVDQSLRTWLCGGEILRAKSSRIAHMFRIPEDARTNAHYKHIQGVDNIGRVVAGWYDEFRSKYHSGSEKSSPNVSNILQLKRDLNCKPFAFFLHRFRAVYLHGGLLPPKVFKLKSLRTMGCILYKNGVGFSVGDCFHGAWFHLANQDVDSKHKCCSGIRVWNEMDCFDRLDPTGPLPYFCDITGNNANQLYRLGSDSRIRHGDVCLSVGSSSSVLVPEPCEKATLWIQVEDFVPEETALYDAAVRRLGLSEDDPAN